VSKTERKQQHERKSTVIALMDTVLSSIFQLFPFRLLRNGFSLVEIRSAEYEALIIRRSRRLSQEDQLSEEEYEDSNSCQEEDCIKKNMEQYERTLRHDKWAETPGLEEENAKINIREEIMSPIKPQRRSIPAGITRLDMCLPYSSPPTKEKETNGCNSSTVWRTGGSPDQPLKIVARRTSCESFDDSLDLSSFSDEEASFEEGDDESDYDDMDSSDEVSVTTYGSEGSLSFDSRLSPSALQNLYAGDISPWPPLQPLVTSARTA
jgi:hypothetical protein